MKRKLQLKQKIMIGAGAGLLGAGAIVTPLVITLSRKQTNVLDDFDNKYGIDRTVYDNMKGDLTNKYRSKLERDQDEDIDAKMAKLASSLLSLDNAVQQYDNGSHFNTYTSATSLLMNKAKFDYEIDLVRNSRANWNEVDEMFDGMSQSFETYMNNHDFDREKIGEVMAAAANQKEAIVAKLKAEYANDVLGGVLKAKTQLLSCFDTINTEIARLAAEIRLVEFNSNYKFEYIERISEHGPYTANRFDVMRGAFTKGTPISNDIMNKIFTCYNVTTRQKIDFDSDNMLPGYKLIPVFAGAIENPITNQYAIQIDWRAVSQQYADGEDAEAATAHLIDVDSQLVNDITTNKDKINTIDDFFSHANEKIRLTNYDMLVTADFESQKLAETYFDGSASGANIELVWEDKFNPCYDGFMYIDQSSTAKQTMNLRQLAMTNIAIKATGCETRLLKEVIATVEQDGYEPKDIIENFVKNCDVVDTVQINKSGDKIISVTNNFSANYKNQVRWDAHGQKSIGSTPFGTTLNSETLEISEVFFEQANSEYNMQRTDSYVLLSNEYNDMYDDANLWDTLSSISLIVQMICQTVFLIQSGVMFTHNIYMGIICLLLCIAAGYMTYIEFTRDTEFNDHFFTPLRKYKENADKFKAEKSLINSVKKEIEDGLEYFVLIDEDHPYNPQEYNDKLTAFRELPKEQQQEIFNKYHYFKAQEPANKFFEEASKLHINTTQFREDFSDWKTPSGTYAANNFFLELLMDVVLGCAIALASMSNNEPQVAGQKTATDAVKESMKKLVQRGKKFNSQLRFPIHTHNV